MKRLLLCTGLLLIWLAVRPDAAGYPCAPTNNCKPLPCEFMANLNLARARVRTLATAAAPSGTNAASAAFDASLAAQRQAYTEYRACTGNAPPYIQVGPAPACSVAPGLQAALPSGNMCSEVIDAENARVEAMQALCQNTGDPKTTADARARALRGAQARLDSLQASLLRYLSSCAPDATLHLQLTDAGLSALRQAGDEARFQWLSKRGRQSPSYDPSGMPGRW